MEMAILLLGGTLFFGLSLIIPLFVSHWREKKYEKQA